MAGRNNNLIPAKKGEIRNPNGKPKGTKHLSTWIQELLNDEEFTAQVNDGEKIVEYKGAPIRAIVHAQMRLAMKGDTKAFDVLGKYGFGTKLELANNPENPLTHVVADPLLIAEFAEFMRNKTRS